jgi:hypothetical protein
MRHWTYVIVGALLLSLAACSSKSSDTGGQKDGKPKDLIVGKWEKGFDIAKETWDFQPDGTLLLELPGLSMNTKYHFTDDKVFTIERGNRTGTIESITGDQMTVRFNNGDKDEFKKVK